MTPMYYEIKLLPETKEGVVSAVLALQKAGVFEVLRSFGGAGSIVCTRYNGDLTKDELIYLKLNRLQCMEDK